MCCRGAILRGLLAAALVTAVASGSVTAMPSTEVRGVGWRKASVPPFPAPRAIPISYGFFPERQPDEGRPQARDPRRPAYGAVEVRRNGTFAFIRPGRERDRYFCLAERVHTRLLGRAERVVIDRPHTVAGRAMPGTTEQFLYLWAQRAEGRREFQYYADQEIAVEPPRAIRKLITSLHRLLDGHRVDIAGLPDDGRTRCREQPR